jgi:hypothetical protein
MMTTTDPHERMLAGKKLPSDNLSEGQKGQAREKVAAMITGIWSRAGCSSAA